MIDTIKNNAENMMKKALDALQHELAKLRTGRAHPSLLDHVRVKYYDNEVPLSQVSTITVGDARNLMISPWEKSMVPAIEKAIMKADLGLNPTTSGGAIRVPMPALTEERRREMTKLVKHEAENSRVSIRNLRRDANNQFKELVKKKEISEDDERRAQELVQKLTDKYIAEVERMTAVKEKELMEV